jgi:hypothetical protein
MRAPNEAAGNRGNKGCRLTDQEITQWITHLQNNASTVFGANIKFTWPDQAPILFVDNLLPNLPGTRTVPLADWGTYAPYFHPGVSGSGMWAANHLNIYFVGNVQKPGPFALAWTIDPKDWFDAGQNGELRGFICINDGGLDGFFGFSQVQFVPGGNFFTLDPPTLIGRNVIEHEMTHYLGRFTNRMFSTASYNGEEHTQQTNNILKTGLEPAPPPFLPGRWDAPATERGEIWQRVFNGNWNRR